MIIAYLYDRQWSTVLNQIHNTIWFNARIIHNAVSTAELRIANSEINRVWSSLRLNNRITVYKMIDWVEKFIIEWYIRWFEADLESISIKIDSKFGVLSDKMNYTLLNHSWPLNTLLSSILSQVNSRENTGISVSCSITDTIVKEYKTWEIISNMIEDLRQNKYDFYVKNNVLYFGQNMGVDRSVAWDDYVEFTFDIENPNMRNIVSAWVSQDIKDLANCTIWKTWTSYANSSDATSITERWRVERPFVSSGSNSDSAAWFIESKKNAIRQFDIVPQNNDFWAFDVGDIVKVYINNGNNFMFYDWPMNVVEKTYTEGNMPIVSVKVSQGKEVSKDFVGKLKSIDTRVNRIEYWL